MESLRESGSLKSNSLIFLFKFEVEWSQGKHNKWRPRYYMQLWRHSNEIGNKRNRFRVWLVFVICGRVNLLGAWVKHNLLRCLLQTCSRKIVLFFYWYVRAFRPGRSTDPWRRYEGENISDLGMCGFLPVYQR